MINNYDNDNIMYFANDDEFAEFCINPCPVVSQVLVAGKPVYFENYQFTKQYLDAVANGIRFCIKDLRSHVNKDGLLGYRTCTKPIDNIEIYYGD